MKKRLICYMLALVVTFAQIVSVGATREEQLRVEQESTNNSLNEAYATIESLEVQKAALSAEINELDQELVNVMVAVNVLKKDISNKETAIKKTKGDLKEAEENKDEQYEAMKKRIQFLYEKGGDSAWLQVLFESKNLPDLLNKAEYTQQMYEYDRANLQKFEDTVEDVKELGVQLEAEKAELVDMKTQQEAQQASLESQLEEKRSASEDYEVQIATAQSQAEEYASLLQQQTEEIARLEAERLAAEEEARRQAQAAAEAEAAARRAEEARLAEEAEKEARRQARAAQEAAEAEAEVDATATAAPEEEDVEDITEDIENIADLEPEETEEEETVTDDEIGTGDDAVDTTDTTTGDDNSADGGSADSAGSDAVQTDEYGNVIDNSTGDVTTPAASTGSGAGQDVVNYALQFVGNPYVWGGTDPVNGADCSGFVQSVYAHFGVALNRTSEAQMANGVSVPYSQAQPGDLICYGSHIAIYMGNGQIVHASNSAPYPAGGIKVSDNAAYRTILDVRRVI